MAGRPKKDIDQKQLFELAKMQCTQNEMAAVLNCHPDTLRDNYSSIMEKGAETGKMSLRRKQYKLADKSAAMGIWLGKQYLGQKDAQLDEQKAKEFVTNIISYAGASKKD